MVVDVLENWQFMASVRLEDVRLSLTKILNGEELSAKDKEDLGWVGHLLYRTDWNSPRWQDERNPDLVALATSIRPDYYKTLQEFGIDYLADGREMLERVYKGLTECNFERISIDELNIFSRITSRLSRDYFIECSVPGP